MNLPTKLTVTRIIFGVIIIILLLFPFYRLNIEFPIWEVNYKEVLEVDSRYIIAGILFVIASITDFFDGMLARKRDEVTDLGKFLDAIADKVLVNSVLIIFASKGIINPLIPVLVIFRDTVVDSIRMIAADKGVVISAGTIGKLKTIFMMCGISLTFFYNIPFELFNIDLANVLLIIGTVLSIYSGFEYYYDNKSLLK